MNLKLLEKLVRLANNNPNENEANLAARKACRLIEDAKFKYQQDLIPNSAFGGAYGEAKRASNKVRTYADVTRSPEPWNWRSSPVDFGSSKSQEDHNKYWNDLMKEFFNIKYGDPFYYKEEKKTTRPEKQKRTCVKCNKEVETVRVTSIFKCNECEWNEYQEEKDKTT